MVSQDLRMQVDELLCPTCGKVFSRKDNLTQHMMIHLGVKSFMCVVCQKAFMRKYNLNRHLLTHAKTKKRHTCDVCDIIYSRKSDFLKHICTQHDSLKKRYVESCSVNKNNGNSMSVLDVFTSCEITPSEEACSDLTLFLNEVRSQLVDRIVAKISEKVFVKWYIVIKAILRRMSCEIKPETIVIYAQSDSHVDLIGGTVSEHVKESFLKLTSSIGEFNERGLGESLVKIVKLELCIAECNSFTPCG